ncbi:hypothetical protein KBD08_00290 [Candidatus Babeliales bacterium]|nr:hypothetical protein [Candidatus Babeliales bacterium]
MLLPDITLLFQLVHFWIAYMLLRHLVFAPALNLLLQDEQHKNQMQKKIEGVGTVYRNLLEQHQQRWSFIKTSLYEMIPRQTVVTVKPKELDSEYVDMRDTKLTSKQKDDLKSMLRTQLSKVE